MQQSENQSNSLFKNMEQSKSFSINCNQLALPKLYEATHSCEAISNEFVRDKQPNRTEHFLLHRIRFHHQELGHQEVVLMPEINRVLKNVFKIMSQANYYLQKVNIKAKKFDGDHLIQLKVLSLLKNDVKVCSYITCDEAKRLLDMLENNSVRDNKTKFYLFSDSCISLISNGKSSTGLQHTRGQSNAQPKGEELDNKNTLECCFYNDKIYVYTDSLAHVAGTSISTGTSWTSAHPNESPAVALEDFNKIASDLEKTNQKKLSNLYLKFSDSNICVKYEDVLNTGNNMVAPHQDDAVADITLNVYSLNHSRIIAMPDINRILKIASGCPTNEFSSIHGALLRKINYYLAKLKISKKRFTFNQMKAVKSHGTELGNATYCSYIAIDEAKKLFNIFKTFNLKYPTAIDKLRWSELISLDDVIMSDKDQEFCRLSVKCKASPSEKSSGVSNPLFIKWYAYHGKKLVDIAEIQYRLKNDHSERDFIKHFLQDSRIKYVGNGDNLIVNTKHIDNASLLEYDRLYVPIKVVKSYLTKWRQQNKSSKIYLRFQFNGTLAARTRKTSDKTEPFSEPHPVNSIEENATMSQECSNSCNSRTFSCHNSNGVLQSSISEQLYNEHDSKIENWSDQSSNLMMNEKAINVADKAKKFCSKFFRSFNLHRTSSIESCCNCKIY